MACTSVRKMTPDYTPAKACLDVRYDYYVKLVQVRYRGTSFLRSTRRTRSYYSPVLLVNTSLEISYGMH